MPETIEIVNPLADRAWDDQRLKAGAGSFFHCAGWARTLGEAYGFRPMYLTAAAGATASVCLPMMEVRSAWTGTRGVSLPFSDYCEILADGAAVLDRAVERVFEIGRRRGWRYVEFRSGAPPRPEATPFLRHLRHVLDLTGGEAGVLAALDASTRRAVAKAGREGVTASADTSEAALRAFYGLHARTRRRHGLPPPPFSFFKCFREHVLLTGRGFIVLARQEGRPLAAAVFVHFGGKALFKYGASDERYQDRRPSNLAMWEGIRQCLALGCRELCLGRTERDHTGLRRFKQGWGTTEEEWGYYRYDFRQETFVVQNDRVAGAPHRFFRMAPYPLSRALGAVLYRHMG